MVDVEIYNNQTLNISHDDHTVDDVTYDVIADTENHSAVATTTEPIYHQPIVNDVSNDVTAGNLMYAEVNRPWKEL